MNNTMKWLTPKLWMALTMVIIAISTDQTTKAATDINISSYYTDSWGSTTLPAGIANGPDIASAPQDGNTGTGITFGDWNGNYVEVGADYGASNPAHSSPFTMNFTFELPTNPSVNALLNTFYGQSGAVNDTIVFQNSLGETASFSQVGDQTIRDYNTNIYTDLLPGFNTDPSYGNVTATNWWNNSLNGGGQRLDVATFVLPSSWAGTNLVSMTIINPYASSANTDDVILSALQIGSVPEPSILGLFCGGLLGLLALRLIRHRKLKH